jgi:diaminohydroxyphosphoribosylaminopyrimidine deaminase/5-amino-6-(5-phosphoribosylamino)uracil reductase
LVGCVLERDGHVVGEGWHARAGGPHAEILALQAAGEAAHRATAHVTLEPCSHIGRTGPCTAALARAGIAHLLIGMADPNPEAAGGADVLRAAGVAVEFASDPRPFEALNEEWLHRLRTGRPFVRVKIALTLDGRPSLARGARSAITGQSARDLSMRLRAEADAILVGTGTVAVDDPSLTVRDTDGVLGPHQPRRYVLTRTEQPSADARMFRDGAGPVGVLVPDALDLEPALSTVGARGVSWDAACGLADAFRALADDGVVSLLVEAGPRMFSSLISHGLIDELVLLHAGGVAGEEAPSLYVGESQEDSSTLQRDFRAVEAGVVGSDAVTVWRPRVVVSE